MAMNVRGLVHALGGQAALQRELDAKGYEITLNAIERWCARESIAARWIVPLQKIADTQGNDVNVLNYLNNVEAADND